MLALRDAASVRMRLIASYIPALMLAVSISCTLHSKLPTAALLLSSCRGTATACKLLRYAATTGCSGRTPRARVCLRLQPATSTRRSRSL